MNREFKFRAWHKRAKEMLFERLSGDVFKWYHEHQDIVIMQFTGLIDKNGKDVFENDIINDDGSIYQVVFGEYTNKGDLDIDIFIVGFLRKYRDGGIGALGYYKGFEGIVIGNSFENPELLNP